MSNYLQDTADLLSAGLDKVTHHRFEVVRHGLVITLSRYINGDPSAHISVGATWLELEKQGSDRTRLEMMKAKVAAAHRSLLEMLERAA